VQRSRLLYVVTEDWYFISHRLPMARAARNAGFEVHVATRVGKHGEAIRAEGFVVHEVPFARGRLSPVAALRTVKVIRDIHNRVKPVISHHVALQPALFASLAAMDSDIVCINAVTGFGYAFTSKTPKATLLRPVVSQLLRLVLRNRENLVLVQNPDDHASILKLGVPRDRIVTIAGSGVDLERFSVLPEPTGPFTIGFAGRLLLDKGVHVLVEAQQKLRSQGRNYELIVAGETDPANPTSVPIRQIDEWKRATGVHMLGHVGDISKFWQRAHIAVLPSRREGLPKSLLEAAACGRALIAADVPGSREVVRPGATGLLVPVDNAAALADAIERLATNSELRQKLGLGARRLAEERFGSELIAAQVSALYSSILGPRNARV